MSLSVHEKLFEKFGPLMSPEHLEIVFHRPFNGLRYGMDQAQRNQRYNEPVDPFYSRLLKAKTKKGKRIYFRTKEVADIVSESE